ncbi:hypothetical protein V6B08_19770 [Ferrovibrio sp. MS7]|uniref:hypothetical protein n=1 Tax=Ferrovibrio plantarum TaxID=3119164 RepID=UPI0031360900
MLVIMTRTGVARFNTKAKTVVVAWASTPKPQTDSGGLVASTRGGCGMRCRFLIVAFGLLLLAIAKPGLTQWHPLAPPPPKWTASISLISGYAHAYRPPPSPSTGTSPATVAQTSAPARAPFSITP